MKSLKALFTGQSQKQVEEIVALQAQIESLKSQDTSKELMEAKATIEKLTVSAKEFEAKELAYNEQVKSLTENIKSLEAKIIDFDTAVAAKAQTIVASLGIHQVVNKPEKPNTGARELPFGIRML